MKIIEYWSDAIKRLDLMQTFSEIETPVLEEANNSLDRIKADLYIETATERGLARHEKTLGILAPEGASLEDRRIAIIAYLNTKIPYTKNGLHYFLTSLVGKDGYALSIDYAKRNLLLKLDLSRKHQLQAIKDMLRRIIPANMEMSVTLRYNQVYMLKQFTVDELKAYTVEDLRSNGEIKQKFIEKGGVLIE